MPKGNSGIKRSGEKKGSKRSKTFAFSGLGKISAEALKAVLEAPEGTRIQAHSIGFGSASALNYEITLRGMSKKMLRYIHKPEDGYHAPVVLSKANVKKKLSGSAITLVYP